MTDFTKSILIGAFIGFAVTSGIIHIMAWAYAEGKASCAQEVRK